LINGVELSWRERGAGPPLLLLHETAATAAIWEPLVEAVGASAGTIALDRRGWGGSGAPETYAATTVEEQAADADALLRELDAEPAVACGAGLGAVVALELILRHRDRVRAAVMIEPPLLALTPEATEGLSGDRVRIGEALSEGGPGAAVDLYLRGGLPYLGPGAERIPAEIGDRARERPMSLFAELGSVPAWTLRSGEMLSLELPSRIVVGELTPALLRSVADQLALRVGNTKLVEVGGAGLPHTGGAGELAQAIGELI
jgi:pimeloyl-ACP methyl ester carboxylesterase